MKPDETCAAILLAAGASSRFGGDKLAAKINDEKVLERSAKALADAGCDMRAAIISETSKVHAPLLQNLGFEIIVNAHAHEGMSASLRAGIEWASDHNALCVLIALADMPFAPPAHLRSLLHSSQKCEERAAFTACGARRSPPAVFGSQWFETLRALKGDAGARDILAGLPARCAVKAPEKFLRDIDTPQDLDAG
ncbi:nucleotidyltransferase family protein [Hyphococcus luteus]|uniref:MobA-like NTP transferase domain-containing protein n=1 Tax=Hyphococcus luteus TaxID=2058213 RepID=A0A2S7K0M2_9PROT|nr:nucleotidyltransferase family protein [Marinicaulis flavus]PQA86052.1 hypothetical protein CW354_16890 [Marinicaulis flavus]